MPAVVPLSSTSWAFWKNQQIEEETSMDRALRMVLVMTVLGLGALPLHATERTATIKVYGMSCPMCAQGVAASLKRLKGVEKAEVSVKKAQAVVVYDDHQVTLAEIKKQIDKSGFSTKPKSP
jgi:copper chaperone